MSVLAVRANDAGYEIAADSIIVGGWSQRKDMKLPKLVEVNGMILGATGTCEESSLFYLYLKGHRPSPTEDSILECLAEFGSWKDGKTGSSKIENQYFLGFDREVFAARGFYVHRVHNYDAMGAGEDFATAALYLGHSPVKAVQTAIELSPYCEGPVVGFERPSRP